MEKIVSRSLEYFAQPHEVAYYVREVMDRGIVSGIFCDSETWGSCEPEAIEKAGSKALGASFFHLFSEIRPGFDADRRKAIERGCYVRLATPRQFDGIMLKSGLDTKGPPERARFFARVARVFRKNFSSPTFGFTKEMDYSVAYREIWHSAGARRFLIEQGKWKQFRDGSVCFDFREPEGKPMRL